LPLKDVRRSADNRQVERRWLPLLGVALACCAIAIPAATAAVRTHHRASALDAGIIAQLNVVRAHAGLRTLHPNGELTVAARGHSAEMTDLGYFSHDSANGASMVDRVRESYVGGRRWTVGENLLWSSPAVGSLRAVTLWMASPEHRAIILTPGWRDIGCASVHADAAPGVYADLPVTVVTCDFGVRS
jgi:uncharacterized protein YkwD